MGSGGGGHINTKTGIVNSNTNIGLQTVWRKHNQEAQFGNNIYKGNQERVYMNLAGNADLWNANHTLKYGISYSADRFQEQLAGNIFETVNFGSNTGPIIDLVPISYWNNNRVDLISGVFSEYNYKSGENFNLNAGFRTDYYNITGRYYYSPRVNIKYNPSDRTVIRMSAGKGFRVSNAIVDNIYYLASSRKILISPDIKPEEASNYGINFSYCFYLLSREGTFNMDAYYTDFENQVVANIDNTNILFFHNTSNSEAISMQFDLAYELFDRLDFKTAYKYNFTSISYDLVPFTTLKGNSGHISNIRAAALTPIDRVLVNMAYETKRERWKFDFTANYIGKSRVPSFHQNSDPIYSDPFTIYNTQVTRKVKEFDIYIGVENLFSYVQENPIIDAENPFSDTFDASLIYGPVMGRLIYAGLRYKIK